VVPWGGRRQCYTTTAYDTGIEEKGKFQFSRGWCGHFKKQMRLGIVKR